MNSFISINAINNWYNINSQEIPRKKRRDMVTLVVIKLCLTLILRIFLSQS